MEIRIDRDDDKRRWTFSGSYSDHDLQGLRLDEFDNAVLMSPMNNGADILQNLEILFRRYYEQMDKPANRFYAEQRMEIKPGEYGMQSEIPNDVVEAARVLNMKLHSATELGQRTQWIAEAFLAEREAALSTDPEPERSMTDNRNETVRQAQVVGEQHPDDLAVDRFAASMKAKLSKKRVQGRGGWEDKSSCSQSFLSELLREHVDKGDPIDVANIAMMLHQRNERITESEKASLDAIAGMTEDQI